MMRLCCRRLAWELTWKSIGYQMATELAKEAETRRIVRGLTADFAATLARYADRRTQLHLVK